MISIIKKYADVRGNIAENTTNLSKLCFAGSRLETGGTIRIAAILAVSHGPQDAGGTATVPPD
jgi:hypothetical protein